MTETQLTIEAMIQRIYGVIARKDLSMGCLIQRYDNIVDTVLHVENLAASVFWCLRMQNGYLYSETTTRDNIEKCTIIGHPVMIGDVLDWFKNIPNRPPLIKDLLLQLGICWIDTRKPIELQDDECISYVFSLLPTTEGN